MTNQHPITPSPEQVDQWFDDAVQLNSTPKYYIARQAALWSADQELDACITFVDDNELCDQNFYNILRAARRPKPPSLKEQAKFAAAVLRSPDETCSIAELQQHWHTIANALEALPND